MCLLKAERQRRLERMKHKQSQLQELILQVQRITSCLSEHHLTPALYMSMMGTMKEKRDVWRSDFILLFCQFS